MYERMVRNKGRMEVADPNAHKMENGLRMVNWEYYATEKGPMKVDMPENWDVFVERGVLVLRHEVGGGYTDYEIDLETITDWKSMLSWVGQIMEKNWCTPELLWNMLYALEYEFGDFRGEFIKKVG